MDVHAPALADAGVALRGLVGAVLITLRDILTCAWSRMEEWDRGGVGAPSVALTPCLLSLWGHKIYVRVRQKHEGH